MAKGFWTQGIAILLDSAVSLDEIEPLLGDFEIVRRVATGDSWEMGGDSLLIAFRPEVNGFVALDVVNRPWPDTMGDPENEITLFGAWSMGYFGPLTFQAIWCAPLSKPTTGIALRAPFKTIKPLFACDAATSLARVRTPSSCRPIMIRAKKWIFSRASLWRCFNSQALWLISILAAKCCCHAKIFTPEPNTMPTTIYRLLMPGSTFDYLGCATVGL
jgi:hypothetical protein